MMKKFLRTAVIFLLTAMICLSVVGCNGSIPANTALMWVAGGSDELRYLDTIATEYNKIDDSKQIRFISMGTYNTMLESFKYGNNLPDIVYIDDEYFKRFVDGNFLKPLDELLEESTLDISSMWPQAVSRYRYNPENNTSNASDPLWAIPKELDSTVLYYNEGAFTASGITVISVPEEKIAEFNAGTYRDGNGKLKSEYPALSSREVLAKGYMRDNPYTQGNIWVTPQSGELLVFNNRIPMSWDEVEDLAMYMTRSYRTASPTLYGYYTEFWFNYGWSVGGDCIGDINGDGQWEFTLDDNHPNYKVLKDTTINGVEYKASGEGNDFVFVEYKEKNWLAANEATAESLVADGTLEKFPSTLEAFTRFAALSRDTTSTDPVGLAVAQKPSGASAASDTNAALGKFNMGTELAMFVGFSDNLGSLSTKVNWNIAPLPVYKTYNLNGSIKQIGMRSGHGRGYGVGIVSNTEKTEIAMDFLEYFLGESGQKALAGRGERIPNNMDIAMSDWLKSGKNYEQVVIETQYQRPGDWWYMPERAWIANWSQPLNQNQVSVRNSNLTLTQYFLNIKQPTNEALQKFWKK